MSTTPTEQSWQLLRAQRHEEKLPPPFPVVKPSPVHGMGLFALQPYQRGEFITRYGGIEITELEKEKKEWLLEMNPDYRLRGLNGRLWDAIVVLKPLEERGRWVNDYRGQRPQPNCFFCFDPDSDQMVLRALERVEAGEEFFTDYGNDYWNPKERKDLLKEGFSN